MSTESTEGHHTLNSLAQPPTASNDNDSSTTSGNPHVAATQGQHPTPETSTTAPAGVSTVQSAGNSTQQNTTATGPSATSTAQQTGPPGAGTVNDNTTAVDDDIPVHPTGYRLRARADVVYAGAWIDEDESGTFDASGQRDRLTPPPPRAPRRPREPSRNGEGESSNKRQRTSNWLSGRQHGETLMITLKLSPLGLRNFPAGESVEMANVDGNEATRRNGFDVASGQLPSYGLRNRTRTSHNDLLHPSLGIRDESHTHGYKGITLGHVKARGCKGCVDLGQPCSLEQYGAKWPCETCKADRQDCELIVAPAQKQSCQRCRKKNVVCSYLENSNYHDLPCQNCQQSGFACVAAPKPDRARLPPGVADLTAYIRKLQIFDLDPGRPHISCTPCLKVRANCSIRTLNGKGPCVACKDDRHRPCTFERYVHPIWDLASSKTTNRHGDHIAPTVTPAADRTASPPSVRIETGPPVLVKKKNMPPGRIQASPPAPVENAIPAPRLEDSYVPAPFHVIPLPPVDELRKYQTYHHMIDLTSDVPVVSRVTVENGKLLPIRKTITTCFCWPMTFYNTYTEPGRGYVTCHFCNDVGFGMFGYGERTIDVLDYGTGINLTEIPDGQPKHGRVPTRMCMFCAIERIRIVKCDDHEISPIDGLDPDNFDFVEAFETIEQGIPVDECPIMWCSLCPLPAFYCCNKKQKHALMLEELPESSVPTQSDLYGCGLLLCEDCARITLQHGGRLHPSVEERKKQLPPNGRMRADVPFLLNGTDIHNWLGKA